MSTTSFQADWNSIKTAFVKHARDVPPEISMHLWRIANNPEKRIWIVSSKGTGEHEKASHGRAFDVEPDAYIGKINDFLTEIRP